ncbi:glutathione synthetase ATP-binding domain-like protein [Hortaea werneckii]|nr:glutathione synthetase ATP-binding domain-like protein [Hortaea werneckii]
MRHIPFLLVSSWRAVAPNLQHRPVVAQRLYARSIATKVAVLYQATPPPLINGVKKPAKPGGYQDSGADIAFNLQSNCGIDISTPQANPDPARQEDWCFPDTEEGVVAALDTGKVRAFQDKVRVVGQPPCLVELYDDKRYVNDLLRDTGRFTMPRAWTLNKTSSGPSAQVGALKLPYPVVAKPCRGRGSAGVKVCHTPEELAEHAASLYQDSSTIMIEEYLTGEEATITVMPPSSQNERYWAMPIVTRFNHEGGIAPYNGSVAVTSNSRVVKSDEFTADNAYREAAKECEAAAKMMRVTAPIRVDIRRREDKPSAPFVLFDVNMKPNLTGPGRPGRDEQASLTAMAAAHLGWNYPRLLQEVLSSSQMLRHLRHTKPQHLRTAGR